MGAVCVHIHLPLQPPRSSWAAGREGSICVPGVGCQHVPAGTVGLAEAAERGGQGWQQSLPQAHTPRLSFYTSRRRGPRSRGSSNEMEQQKDGEIRLPALPQQIKRWD